MPWNADWPVNTISVKANQTKGDQNMKYIQATMGITKVVDQVNNGTELDHFWNVGANEDGRHRYINSLAYTVGGTPADVTIGTGMDGVLYLKTTNSSAEWFRRNSNNIYQLSPNFLSGTHVVTASYTNIIALPANVYGDVFMWQDAAGKTRGQTGFFKTNATICSAWAYGLKIQGGSTAKYNVEFGKGSDSSGLNLRVVASEATAGATWNYRITYRAI